MYPMQNSHFPNMPDLSHLCTLPRRKQRRIIGEYLYPLICNMYPNFMPHKLTDILLDLNSIGTLIDMINDPTVFAMKLGEAINVLQTYFAVMTLSERT
ncbi:uncharacterized protein LOC112462610 [Temnothorax curvispinosus]|uniref:Uncharacterized protein LOC112462610 n=1 Tax=Temnothorax curvispinosus TaxID=300111 RepID=A0A6J1QP52_9HYME|nr:uncharacterized protein LOC112462610 [Temnothorax curvispinosus]